MPPRQKYNSNAQQQREAVASEFSPSPPSLLEKDAPAAAAAAADAAAPSPSPSPPAPPAAAAPVVDGAARNFITSPGYRFLANFQDLFNSVGVRVVPAFQDFEAELSSELSSLAELTGELRAARAASEAKLRLGRRWLKDLKSVILEEIDGDDGDVDGGGEGDGGGSGHPFGDADTVAGRSSGVFSDPALSL